MDKRVIDELTNIAILLEQKQYTRALRELKWLIDQVRSM